MQIQVLNEVEAAFDAGHEFVFVEAPTGSGKSLLAMTLANRYGSAYICTISKLLQKQYVDEFEKFGVRTLKGMSSFDCDRAQATCDVGDELKVKCLPSQYPYRLEKAEALMADVAVCNYYSYLFSVGNGRFSTQAQIDPDPDETEEDEERHWHRQLLVLDEIHEAESVLMEVTGVSINASKLPIRVDAPFPPRVPTTDECFAWLEAFLREAMETNLDDLSSKAKKELRELVGKANFAIGHRGDEEWIAESIKDGRGFALKPLTVKSFAHRLFRYGNRTLLMSATILDAAKMADSLGIKEYAYVSTACSFPVENRQVIVSGLNMTKQHRDRAWPLMVDQIGLILDSHHDEKGLILTPSNEMLDYILQRLPKKQGDRLILARGKDRLERYHEHLETKRCTVLAASGLWEGADLKNDYSRFQIIPALPRPYWGGQIEARARNDKLWYRLQTFQQLVQGVGRSVRSETDSATTYVLDQDLKREADRPDSLLPAWFKEALIYA